MPDSQNTCRWCDAPIAAGRTYCNLSCQGKSNIRATKAWEQEMAKRMEERGWTVFSPTACCDRIAIKDGRVFFLEFKPQTDTNLRPFQAAVRDAVPHMYKVVLGSGEGRIVAVLSGGAGTRDSVQRKKRANTSSRFVGVTWRADKQRWIARITINGKAISLGHFRTEEAAARAYEDERNRHQRIADIHRSVPKRHNKAISRKPESDHTLVM